ncbi:MAG: type II toxin-antitoxin system VapC family toxin [Methanoculleus sp.]|nr:type II toxin-antitoxin system VapC family toxin [Methanoculleus sp.]
MTQPSSYTPSLSDRSFADDYRESTHLARNHAISINDALAVVVMEREGINEIYTFDRHFRETRVKVVQE